MMHFSSAKEQTVEDVSTGRLWVRIVSCGRVTGGRGCDGDVVATRPRDAGVLAS